jgi:conjugal transfer pilus assembly protein TraB
LKVSEKDKFIKRKTNIVDKKDITIIPKKDFKESWAISVENAIEKQNKLMQVFIDKTSSELNSSRVELKNMLFDSIAKQKDYAETTKENLDAKFNDFKRYIDSKLEAQDNRIEEISVMNGGGNLNSINILDNNEKYDEDLIPEIPQKKESKKELLSKIKEEEKESDNFWKQFDKIPDSVETKITENNKKEDGDLKKDSFPKTNSFNTPITKEIIPQYKNPIKIIPEKKEKRKVSMFNIDTSKNKEEIIKEEKERKAAEKGNNESKIKTSYHIMIGLAKAYMITGAYAPAFSAGDADPLPVLLQAEGDILIANDDSENVDHCLFIGSAKGNMNSRTADIRLTRISCSLNDGKQKIEGPITGWVIGENGIPGVPGQLLHKNGAWLAQTFVAGFMQTFANAFQNQGSTQIAIGGGGTETTSGNAFKENVGSAFGGGLSTIFGKLGQYYLKMAEQIFPVIEVKAGRTVDILLKGGETLKITDFNKADIAEINKNLETENIETLPNSKAEKKKGVLDNSKKRRYYKEDDSLSSLKSEVDKVINKPKNKKLEMSEIEITE